MKKTHLFFISIVVLLFLNNCKKKSETTNPCEGEFATSADFVVEQQVGDKWFAGDTIISSQFNNVRFTAKQNADSYTWEIGSETITTKSFIRNSFPEKSIIPIRLIVKRNSNTSCFPDDNGMDTVKRFIYVWPNAYGLNPAETPIDTTQSPYLPIYGTYYGESTFAPGVKKFVTIIDTVWTDEFNKPARVGLLRGIPHKTLSTAGIRNADLFHYAKDYGIRAIYLNMSANIGLPPQIPTIPKMKGYAWLDQNNWNKITIDYKFIDTVTNQWIDDYFTGERVW